MTNDISEINPANLANH